MSGSHFNLSAVAFQLAAALESYDEEVAQMVRSPLNTATYQRVSRRMDEMRLYAVGMPPLAVAWVEVMIRHFELTHGLWRAQQDASAAGDLARHQEQLRQAVSRLKCKCVQLMPSA